MGFWARMDCCDCRGTEKVEINWCSATVSNAQQRQEQSFRTIRRATPERKGSHLEVCMQLISFIASVMTLCSFIRKSCVCTCWNK